MQFVFSWKSTLDVISYEDGNKLLEVVALRLGEIRLLVLRPSKAAAGTPRCGSNRSPALLLVCLFRGLTSGVYGRRRFPESRRRRRGGPNEHDQFRPPLFVEQIRGLPKEERRLNHRHWGGTHLCLNNTLLAHRGKILAHNDKRSD